MASNFPRKMSLVGNLWQILKGYAVDTSQGGFPIVQPIVAPALGTNTAIHAAVTLSTVVQKVSTGITNPDFPRALLVKGNQSDCDGTITVYGKNYAGESVKETITASGSSAVVGNVAFATVDYILFPAKSHNSQTLSVGTTNKFGLKRPLVNSSLTLLTVNGVAENPAAVSQTYNTFTPTTAPNGSRLFVTYYDTDIF